jgi:hypothetical protein
MDKVVEYLTDKPDGASAEEIARDAIGLRGAIGVVAAHVVRAAADGDERIVEGPDGQWFIGKGRKEKGLRGRSFVTIVSRMNEKGVLMVGATRTGFEGPVKSVHIEVPPHRSESTLRVLENLADLADGAVTVGFRLPTSANLVNRAARFYLGRTLVGDGLCLSRLARRCFPGTKIQSCSDIAESLELPYGDVDDLEELSATHSELLLGLLENCETRGLHSIEDVLADLFPTVTSVNFEAFAFDQDYLDDLPESPGVYVMRDSVGKVVYVGKSVHLRDRVKTYFAKRSERTDKTLRILDRIWTVEVEVVGSELEALILEARMIQATQPEFNKQTEVHERDHLSSHTAPFLVLLPSSDPDCIEIFCVRSDREIRRVGVRKDLADWAASWVRVESYLTQEAVDLDPVEIAGHQILESWIHQNTEKVNLIDVGDAGEKVSLKRLVEEHIRDTDNEAWERVWRV